MNRNERCPACRGTEIIEFLELEQVPVHCNVLWPTAAEARAAPRGDIRLGFCRACSLIYNLSFEPALTAYEATYENSLHFSPRFQEYARGLAAHLADRYALAGKTVIEIGAGKGEFLALLCETAGAEGVGFDPTFENGHLPEGVSIVRDFYSERYAEYSADLVYSRHTLEHVAEPREFLGAIRRAIGVDREIGVFFEVPNATFALRDQGVWDIIYEHCSYFTPLSLRLLFEESGFLVERLAPAFGDQFLTLEASAAASSRPAGRSPEPDVEVLEGYARSFGDVYRSTVKSWGERLAAWRDEGERVAIWGAGSKGVTFLNSVLGAELIGSVVDINPRKIGRHVPGTGQPILSPEDLLRNRPDWLIVMNPVYEEEIRGMASAMSLRADVVSIAQS